MIFDRLIIWRTYPSKSSSNLCRRLGWADLELTVQDYRFEYYDPDYFKDMESEVWDNEVFINLTITNSLPLETEIRVQLIAATMGEYKIPTGIEVIKSLCESIKDPIYVDLVLKFFDPIIEDCPPKLGPYMAQFKFEDLNTMPDTFPPNNYLVVTSVFSSEKPLFELHRYASTR